MDRNEAIQVIRKNYPHVSESGTQFETALRILIPELKENDDERMWKLIKKYAHYNISDIALGVDHITREQLESWIEKQCLQNPACSEDDEKMVEDLIEAIDTEIAVSDYNKMVGWLKSLKERYTWKPSDEQMTALSIIKDSGNTHEHEVLDSLYYDLKKLKG